MRAILVNEALTHDDLNRDNMSKIDLSQVDFIYHWMTEGKFFDACYNQFENTSGKSNVFILQQLNDKSLGEMPTKPIPNYLIGNNFSACLTVDPSYTDVAFNDEGSCIVFDAKKLLNNHKISEDLTDNGEAEIRIKNIKDWPNYIVQIDIPKEVYFDGLEWEGAKFRPIIEWIPEELKSKVNIFIDEENLINSRL